MFKHTCEYKDCCKFLKTTNRYDIYITAGGEAVLMRYSDEPDGFFLFSLKRCEESSDPSLVYAAKLVMEFKQEITLH
jgi:hypothetical protein